MNDEDLNYEVIRKLYNAERRSSAISKIAHGFYEDVEKWIAAAETRYQEELRKNPGSKKASIAGDELRNVQRMIDDIYYAREAKIVRMAVSEAKGIVSDTKILIPEEREMYAAFTALLKQSKKYILHGEASALALQTEPQETAAPTALRPMRPEQTGAPVHTTQAAAPRTAQPVRAPLKPANPDILPLRILEDVPQFVGNDQQIYSLKKEDVVTLPKKNARILLDHKKAAALSV